MNKIISFSLRRVILIVIVLLLANISISCTQPKLTDETDLLAREATPLIWKVYSERSYIFLFGSIHVAKKNLYPLNDVIMNAYASCDYIALEADPSDYKNSEVLELMSSYMKYTDGTKISDIIGNDLYNRIINVLRKQYPKLNEDALEIGTPMMFLNLLQGVAMEKAELSDEYGIDLHFYNRSRNDGKEILSIEPFELQMKVYSEFSTEVNKYMLEEIVDTDANAQLMKELYATWLIGDVDAIIETELLDETQIENISQESYHIYKRLGVDRNMAMADAATEYLEDGKKVFFIVGVAHMLGEQGIVALLENRGYTVELLDHKMPKMK